MNCTIFTVLTKVLVRQRIVNMVALATSSSLLTFMKVIVWVAPPMLTAGKAGQIQPLLQKCGENDRGTAGKIFLLTDQ